MHKLTKRNILELFMIMLGCAIYGLSLDMISAPNQLTDGGISGITLLLRHFWGINMGLSSLLLNIPLIILGYRFMGKRLLAYTIWGTLWLSFFLWFWRLVPIIYQLNLEHDLFLSAILAGTLSGIGLGLVFRYNGTSGGTDIIARICQIKYGLSSGKVLLFCDAIILFASLSYLDLKHIMYTLVASFILSRVMDTVQQGAYSARGLLIISDNYEKIAEMIDLKLDRGFTYLEARGGYKKTKRPVIYLVVSPREIPAVKELIAAEDPKAFVSVIEVHEALGEGFTYKQKRQHLLIRK
ncbi:YitT family protein [Lactobacillus sp. M0403]|uniref:YitT family protein n=1 Tax=Lactobacillus TaxID=1578 RepID=UPI000EFD6DCA|nr:MULTISPECIES: YitT family protein [Lactobacillus]MBH9985381.1 YitT family protein [Lactobacillus sp. M0390]MBI0092938.1 YitT family protein [Lactobacillus sp. M0403]MCO6529983.1 YitT family protein [Lactobacillus sp.]RMC50234.1 YitT family protein [Lactobacillus sp. ESL0263]WLS85574.1 YitT family protein [Lactobacillus apis]